MGLAGCAGVPTFPHEAPLAVLREDPSVVALLLRELGVDVPEFEEADVADADFTQVVPAEFRADLVVCLRGPPPERAPVMGIVVEVQRTRDDRKRRTWPLYLAALHARLECATCLVVLADDDALAAWAARPIVTLQPGTVLTPIVLGPSQVPIVGGEGAPAHPWLAVLSALVHGNRPEGLCSVIAAIEALARLGDKRARVGYDLIFASLDVDGRRRLEVAMPLSKWIMEYEYQSDFARKYYGEGLSKGVEAFHKVVRDLAAHRLGKLTVAQVERIEQCRDLEALGSAATALGEAKDAEAAERALAALGGTPEASQPA